MTQQTANPAPLLIKLTQPSTLKVYQKKRHARFQELQKIFTFISTVLKGMSGFQQQNLGSTQKDRTKHSPKEVSNANQSQIRHESRNT